MNDKSLNPDAALARADEISKAMRCPSCGSTDAAPLLYGEPNSESFQAWERGDLSLAGPSIEEASPAFECRACKQRFGLAVDQIEGFPWKGARDGD